MGLINFLKNSFQLEDTKKDTDFNEEINQMEVQQIITNICKNNSISNQELKNFKDEKGEFSEIVIIKKLLKDKIIEYTENKKWHLCLKLKKDMFKLLELEKRWKNALLVAFEICYLDINGASIIENNIPRDYPTTLSGKSLPSPIFVTKIYNLSKKLEINIDSIKKLFIEHISQDNSYLFTIEPEEAWDILRKELFKIEKLKSCPNYQD